MSLSSRLLALVGALLLTLPAGCAQVATPDPVSVPSVVIVATGTVSEPAPSLSTTVDRNLHTLAASGGSVLVLNGDRSSYRLIDLTPRRSTGEIEYGFNRGNLINANVAEVTRFLGGLHATSPGMDLVEAMNRATRGVPPGTLVVVSSGMSTSGSVDIRQIGWSTTPDQIAAELRTAGHAPELAHWHVIFTGLGDTAGRQPAPATPTRDVLSDYWLAICHVGGAASCTVDNSERTAAQPTGHAAMPTIDVPVIHSVLGADGRITVSVPASLLGFAGDSSVLPKDAASVLGSTISGIKVALAEDSDTLIVVTGYVADPPDSHGVDGKTLSGERAAAVGGLLIAAHIDPARISTIAGGTAPGLTSIVDGRYNPQIADQMRRVDITY